MQLDSPASVDTRHYTSTCAVSTSYDSSRRFLIEDDEGQRHSMLVLKKANIYASAFPPSRYLNTEIDQVERRLVLDRVQSFRTLLHDDLEGELRL